jgi:hypothetical protein
MVTSHYPIYNPSPVKKPDSGLPDRDRCSAKGAPLPNGLSPRSYSGNPIQGSNGESHRGACVRACVPITAYDSIEGELADPDAAFRRYSSVTPSILSVYP